MQKDTQLTHIQADILIQKPDRSVRKKARQRCEKQSQTDRGLRKRARHRGVRKRARHRGVRKRARHRGVRKRARQTEV